MTLCQCDCVPVLFVCHFDCVFLLKVMMQKCPRCLHRTMKRIRREKRSTKISCNLLWGLRYSGIRLYTETTNPATLCTGEWRFRCVYPTDVQYMPLFGARDGKNNTARPSTAVTFVEGRSVAQLVKNSIGKLQKLN